MGQGVVERLARLEAVLSDETTMGVVCERLSEGETLREVCLAWEVPHGRVLGWILGDEARTGAYLRALEVASHALVGECVGIADGAEAETVGVAKLRIDTRWRVAAAHSKALYGESKGGGGGNKVVVVVNRTGSSDSPSDKIEAVDVTPQE
jgi:hypothetical protein